MKKFKEFCSESDWHKGGNPITNGEVTNNMLVMSIYRTETGRYEFTAYMS